MQHTLPDLSFASDALVPFLTAETLSYHHGKHHRSYVDKLNGLVKSGEHENHSLTELVQKAKGPVFNNAAQHYNHSFYWRCISPEGAKEPGAELRKAIDGEFGSLEKLQEAFTTAATTHFGSGWCWLVRDQQGRLKIRTTSDAGCPVTEGETPLITCDVWEHAYYIDYRNARPTYVKSFWKALNWDFAAKAFSSPDQIESTILGS